MSKRLVNPGWAWRPGRTYNPAVVAGRLLFVSGMDARDEATGRMEPRALVEQCEVIYRKLGEVLAGAGAGYADVVKTTDYIVDPDGYRETAEVRRRYLGPDFPAATGVVVKGLLGAGALIEIDAIALLPGV